MRTKAAYDFVEHELTLLQREVCGMCDGYGHSGEDCTTEQWFEECLGKSEAHRDLFKSAKRLALRGEAQRREPGDRLSNVPIATPEATAMLGFYTEQ